MSQRLQKARSAIVLPGEKDEGFGLRHVKMLKINHAVMPRKNDLNDKGIIKKDLK